jgi:hypothetical protein
MYSILYTYKLISHITVQAKLLVKISNSQIIYHM